MNNWATRQGVTSSQEDIAGVLGVSQSTVSREMCRNRGQRGYRFKQAEAKAQHDRRYGVGPQLTAPLRRKIEENTNGLIRDFFPKGTDFSTIANAEVAKVERLLNARPRKSLGFRSPQEVFDSLAHS